MQCSFIDLRNLLLIVCVVYLVISCRSTSESLIDAGTGHAYQIGFPEVKARATGFFDQDGNPVIDLNTEIPYSSLIYVTKNGQEQARLQMDGMLRNTKDEFELSYQFSEVFEVVPSNYPDQTSIFYERRIPVEPGDYELEILVKDLTSDKTSVIKLFVSVPDPEEDVASISDIRVSRFDENEEIVISSFLVPAISDSITFSFFVTRPEDYTPTRVEMRLSEIRSDKDIPRSISNLPITTGSLAYRGIDYENLTELQVRERVLESETGSILITFSDKIPTDGIYRFEILLYMTDELGEEQSVRRFRDFSIVSPHFPQLKTQDEMVSPLRYIMDRKEFEKINNISDADSLRRAFEQFWLKGSRNQQTAREVIELFYTRVEEANRVFTTFKQGWMTDMGMVFILLGPPLHVENTIDTMVWYYGYDRMDPRTVFRFERSRVPGASFPFQHYILLRQRYYMEIEHSIVQDWRSGRILNKRGL